MFVDKNNTIYVADQTDGNVKEWRNGSMTVTRITFKDLNDPQSLFVTTDGTIYVDNGKNGQIEKWPLNATESTIVINISSACYGLFVDLVNNLYCSLGDEDQVVKQSLDVGEKVSRTVVAGNGSCGSDSNVLCKPWGIFVTVKRDLYVADCYNDRIQLFKLGHSTGITVVGNTEFFTIHLDCPTDILVDANGYLFIVDRTGSRIIGSNSNGFYCAVGCSNVELKVSDLLDGPVSAAFDVYGNFFIADTYSHRIAKFMLVKNTDGK